LMISFCHNNQLQYWTTRYTILSHQFGDCSPPYTMCYVLVVLRDTTVEWTKHETWIRKSQNHITSHICGQLIHAHD